MTDLRLSRNKACDCLNSLLEAKDSNIILVEASNVWGLQQEKAGTRSWNEGGVCINIAEAAHHMSDVCAPPCR